MDGVVAFKQEGSAASRDWGGQFADRLAKFVITWWDNSSNLEGSWLEGGEEMMIWGGGGGEVRPQGWIARREVRKKEVLIRDPLIKDWAYTRKKKS